MTMAGPSTTNGTTASPTNGTAPLEPSTKQTYNEAIELRDHYWPQYDNARKRIKEARDFITKRTQAPVTRDFKLAGVDNTNFRAGLPQQMTSALRLRNFISSRLPELQWYAGQRGESEEIATTLEQWGQAAMETVYPWVQTVDLLQNEGEGGVILVPRPEKWKGYPKPEATSRDSSGRRPTDRYYRSDTERTFARDEGRSRRAYDDEHSDYLAQHFPIEAEAVSLLDAAPINPRWVGAGQGARVEIDGLIRERSYTVSELQRKRYVWWEDGRLISPGNGGGNSQLTLLDEWVMLEDKDGIARPVVTYTVSNGAGASYRTQRVGRDGTLVDAQRNLYDEYGLGCLPVVWEYGWHFASNDVGDRSVPFALPFIDAFLTAMTMISGISVHTLLTGFGGWFVLKDRNQRPTVEDAVRVNAPADDPIRIGAFEVVEIEAKDVRPAVHAGPSPQAAALVQFMLEQIAEAGPPSGAMGGPAENALDRTVMMKQTETALWDITDGSRRLFRESASKLLEVGCAIGRHHKTEVPVYRNVEVPNQGHGARSLVSLDPDEVGSIYNYGAIYPTKPGDNLALASQLWGFYQSEKPGITFTEFREWAFGDKHPEVTRGALLAEMIEASPAGQADILEYVSRKLADKSLKDKIAAMTGGDVGAEGTPEAMMAGLGPPQAPPIGPAGPAPMPVGAAGAQMASAATAPMGDSGQSQMAGIIGAQIQNARRTAAATGAGAGAPPPPGGPV